MAFNRREHSRPANLGEFKIMTTSDVDQHEDDDRDDDVDDDEDDDVDDDESVGVGQ